MDQRSGADKVARRRCIHKNPVSAELYKCVQGSGDSLEIKKLSKDCKFCGKIHRNGTTFKYPRKSCRMYKCLNGEVKLLQPAPFFRGRCIHKNPVSAEPYKCVKGGYRLKKKKRSKDCKFHGKIYKHRSRFFYPRKTCQLQRCKRRKVKYLKTCK
ncbi:kielin/chordin-like protein [Plakobranchus ocellatus]|uniref:Kielin/chordin-like protein n=1 Tax=Plakobranchus ocellatus TaxID=259542 RepID=A0AAV4B9Z3_9GAST|nr:kielin/chordin-like protein [Plakobranchus ocellatus]